VKASRVGLLLCLVALAVLAPVACGVTEDDSPRAISAEDLPEGLRLNPTTSSTLLEGEGEPIPVYFVTGEGDATQPRRLRAAAREVRSPPSIAGALRALLQPPTETELSTVIPPETRLLSEPRLQDGTLTIDLSEEFADVQGPDQALAYAQIVYTVTDELWFSDIERVRFQVEGEDREAPTDDGLEAVVEPDDYQELAPRS
jgi:spore germination protein GerM